MKVLAVNRRARFEYEFLERITAGLALTGSEVKSVREGHVKLQDGWVAFEAGEAFLVGVHIAPYDNAGYANHDPTRRRKLLLHKRDIERLAAKVAEKGLTVVPLAVGARGQLDQGGARPRQAARSCTTSARPSGGARSTARPRPR